MYGNEHIRTVLSCVRSPLFRNVGLTFGFQTDNVCALVLEYLFNIFGNGKICLLLLYVTDSSRVERGRARIAVSRVDNDSRAAETAAAAVEAQDKISLAVVGGSKSPENTRLAKPQGKLGFGHVSGRGNVPCTFGKHRAVGESDVSRRNACDVIKSKRYGIAAECGNIVSSVASVAVGLVVIRHGKRYLHISFKLDNGIRAVLARGGYRHGIAAEGSVVKHRHRACTDTLARICKIVVCAAVCNGLYYVIQRSCGKSCAIWRGTCARGFVVVHHSIVVLDL